jgi:two-component system, LuxR family, response regulator FixJ
VIAIHPVILVVDDDPALCSALKFALELEEYDVRTYESATDLLDDAAMPRPCCLVIDYRLPGMNGLELVARLRKRGIDAPAIMITTSPGTAVREEAKRAGTPIIEKPLLTNALSDAIRRAISAKGGSQ